MGTRLGSEMWRAQPGRWVRRKPSHTKSTPVGVSPLGLGASGALSPKARPEGLGTGFRRGPYCFVILLPSLHGTATLGQQATTDHMGSLGTVPKGQSGHSAMDDQKGNSEQCASSGTPCAPAIWSPTPAGCLLSSCSSAGGGEASQSLQVGGQVQHCLTQYPLFRLELGAGATSSHRGLQISLVAPS